MKSTNKGMGIRGKQNVMYDHGKEKLRMKFDKVEALALVDVLQAYHATDGLNILMMELGKILLRQLKKIPSSFTSPLR